MTRDQDAAGARQHDPAAALPMVGPGARGDAVRDVQRRLARVTGEPVVEDGVFGSGTEQALRAFQRQSGLAADGQVGPETWRRLVEAGWVLGDRLLLHAASPLRGDDVRELQHRLNRLGFDAGQEDGIFGPLARAAVEELQRNVGLAADGLAGPSTLAALRRLHRDHQSGGLGIRARQREALRRLARRGVVGMKLMIDPAGGDTDGEAARLAWDIARRTAARLAARGATAVLSRGPHGGPGVSARARQANELAVDLVLSIAVNRHRTAAAGGSASFYFGAATFVSEPGQRLAEQLQDAVVASGWGPDGRTHPVSWGIVRETRMPAVVVEPGFLTNPADARALRDPARLDGLAAALARTLETFVSDLGGAPAGR